MVVSTPLYCWFYRGKLRFTPPHPPPVLTTHTFGDEIPISRLRNRNNIQTQGRNRFSTESPTTIGGRQE